MLFGNKDFVEGYIAKGSELAGGKEIVYGVTLGSIAKGIQRLDSDYDARLFTFEKDKITEAVKNGTADVKWIDDAIRHIPGDSENNTLYYDKIPVWELNSFLDMLIDPRSEIRAIPVMQYYQVYYTFAAPYQYDPYGLCEKLSPIAWSVMDRHLLLESFEKDLKRRYTFREDGTISSRDYLKTMYNLLSQKWVLELSDRPPVYLESLYYLVDDEAVIEKLREIYTGLVKDALEEEKYQRKVSKYYYMPADKALDDYIKREHDKVLSLWEQKKPEYDKIYDVQKQIAAVGKMRDIALRSLDEAVAKGIND